METDKTSLDDRLILIYNDLQKIIRHFKIDRRAKNTSDDGMETENAAANENGQQLREILARIGEIADRRKFSAEQIEALQSICSEANKALLHSQAPNHQELKSILEAIGQQIDELKTENRESTVRHQHTYTLDFKNIKVAMTIILMGVIIFFSGALHIHQLDIINAYRDNDLKYRRIKMEGSASEGDIANLENIFTYNRNLDSISLIRRDVVQYEKLVKEGVEKQVQADQNASDARSLQEQAKSLKNKR